MTQSETLKKALEALQQKGYTFSKVFTLHEPTSIALKGTHEVEYKTHYRGMVGSGKTLVKGLPTKATTDHNGVTSGYLLGLRHEGESFSLVVLDKPMSKQEAFDFKLGFNLIPFHHTGDAAVKKASEQKELVTEPA